LPGFSLELTGRSSRRIARAWICRQSPVDPENGGNGSSFPSGMALCRTGKPRISASLQYLSSTGGKVYGRGLLFIKQCQQLKAEINYFSDIFINDISYLPDAAPLKLLTLVYKAIPATETISAENL
jgi:hypothetical protein